VSLLCQELHDDQKNAVHLVPMVGPVVINYFVPLLCRQTTDVGNKFITSQLHRHCQKITFTSFTGVHPKIRVHRTKYSIHLDLHT